MKDMNEITVNDEQREILEIWLKDQVAKAAEGQPRFNLQQEGVGITDSYDVNMDIVLDMLCKGGNATIVYSGNELFRVCVVNHPVYGLAACFSGTFTTALLPLEQQ